jgi:hypothetical protein
MDCSNTTKESLIFWNKEAVNPPNQSVYRYYGMMNYLEGLVELQKSSINMLYESNRSQFNKIHSIISASNQTQMTEIQGISKLISDFQRIIDTEKEDHNRFFLKLEDLEEIIRDQFENQEEKFFIPLLHEVEKLKKKFKGIKKQVKSAREELEDIAEVQEEQMELLNDQARSTNTQLEEIFRLQGELMLLLERVNSSIVQLLTNLPVGKKVSSITVDGTEIPLDSFINYDTETNLSTFRQMDGSLVIVESREIVSITFPSS